MRANGDFRGEDERQVPHWLEAVADPVRLGILGCLSENPNATVPVLAKWTQASRQTVRRHLDALVVMGVVHAVPGLSDGERVGRPATIYHLSATTRDSVGAALEACGYRGFAAFSPPAATG